MRLKIIRIIVIIAFIIIALDLVYVQAVKGKYYFNLSTNNRIRVVPLEGWRGKIFDRNGVVLAENRVAYDVTITPQAVEDRDHLFAFLSGALGISQTRLLARFKAKKHTPFAPVVIADDIEREKAIIIEENRFRYPSLFVEEVFKREYPLGQNSSHVIGYVGKVNRDLMKRYKKYGYSPLSDVGKSGVEEFYDLDLRGEQGGYQIEVNSRGQQVRLLSIREPTRGGDITLTIDSRIQDIAMDVMEDLPGSIIVIDTENGEVLSLSSFPDFDPNALVNPRRSKDASALFRNSLSPLINRAISSRFPPGSVFKIPVAICALDTGKITENTTYHCPGYHQVGGIRFGCTSAHGDQNLIEAIAHSCNVYFYHLGLVLGADLLHEYATKFGLGQKTEIDLPYEREGRIPNRKQGILSRNRPWYTGDTLNFVIGQGDVLTTPLQLVHMMATISNGGVEVQPHVIKDIGGIPSTKYNHARELKIDKKSLLKAQQGLRATVTEYTGTAHELENPELYIAGKTGTAQSAPNKEHHAWFVGYAKGRNKNVAFCVFLEHGGSSHNAVAIARRFLLRLNEEGLI
ncbi:MAG: penicillin-binding protein 2 [Candidatus Omnitrophica bacterium]|nr:penicillin-binding protein 2 [Candidatus Omnitrophota bacterium]